jgi:hypothetical protein
MRTIISIGKAVLVCTAVFSPAIPFIAQMIIEALR